MFIDTTCWLITAFWYFIMISLHSSSHCVHKCVAAMTVLQKVSFMFRDSCGVSLMRTPFLLLHLSQPCLSLTGSSPVKSLQAKPSLLLQPAADCCHSVQQG